MTRTPMTFTLWTATCIAVITVLGCGDEIADPGTVIAEWEITIGCTVSEVSEVEARLVDLQSNLGNNSYDSAFRTCNDAEPIVFGRVPAGEYRLEIEGFSEKGEGTYLGVLEGIQVKPGETIQPPLLLLTQKKGAIDIKWVFSNGELCAANSVANVQLSVLDSTSSQLYEEPLGDPISCDPFTLTAEERTIGSNPEPSRDIEGILVGDLIAGTYFIYAYGLGTEGNQVRKGHISVEVELGEVAEAKVALALCESEEYADMSCD